MTVPEKGAEPTGVDLARVALRAAREQARAQAPRPSRRSRPGAAAYVPGPVRTGVTRCRWPRRSPG